MGAVLRVQVPPEGGHPDRSERAERVIGSTGVGTLGATALRTWVGPPVPTFVPLVHGTLELFLLDPTPAGYFAFYRDP